MGSEWKSGVQFPGLLIQEAKQLVVDSLPFHAESASTMQMIIPPGNSRATKPLTLGFECSSESEVYLHGNTCLPEDC